MNSNGAGRKRIGRRRRLIECRTNGNTDNSIGRVIFLLVLFFHFLLLLLLLCFNSNIRSIAVVVVVFSGSSSKTTNNKNTNTSKDGDTSDDASDSTSTEFISTIVGSCSGGRIRGNAFLNDVRSSSRSRDGSSTNLHVGDRVGLRVNAGRREESEDLGVTTLEARGDEGTRDGVAVDGSRSDGDVIGRKTKSLGDVLLKSGVEAGRRNFLNLGRASSTSSSSSLNTSNEVEGVNTDPPRADAVVHGVGGGVEDVAANLGALIISISFTVTIDEVRDGVVVGSREVGASGQTNREIHLVNIVANTNVRSARIADSVCSSESSRVDEAVAGVAFAVVVEAIHVVVVGADRTVSSAVNGSSTAGVVSSAHEGGRLVFEGWICETAG